MHQHSPFERWQRPPAFSLAIFKPNCIGCAISLGLTRRKATTNPFAGWPGGGAVSETEQRALLELGARGFAVGSDREFEKFLRYARALHQRMLQAPDASPVALAIVGVIANYAIPSPTTPGRRGRILASGQSVATSDP